MLYFLLGSSNSANIVRLTYIHTWQLIRGTERDGNNKQLSNILPDIMLPFHSEADIFQKMYDFFCVQNQLDFMEINSAFYLQNEHTISPAPKMSKL